MATRKLISIATKDRVTSSQNNWEEDRGLEGVAVTAGTSLYCKHVPVSHPESGLER